MNFFAYLNRMKYIERWSLMRSTVKENIMEHSQSVSVIAHALAIINNRIFGGSADSQKTAMLALYHESAEVITGDLPTPIKYFNADIKSAYKELEKYASIKLLSMLPKELRQDYEEFLLPDTSSYEYRLCKAADKIAAYIKCLEELKSGNKEFSKAKAAIKKDLDENEMPEVRYFMKNFIPPYKKTLDELE